MVDLQREGISLVRLQAVAMFGYYIGRKRYAALTLALMAPMWAPPYPLASNKFIWAEHRHRICSDGHERMKTIFNQYVDGTKPIPKTHLRGLYEPKRPKAIHQ